ncbi:MAG: hypothetical protein U0670_21975 [Anaerolineae bacterium]
MRQDTRAAALSSRSRRVMDADNRVNGFSGLVRDVTYVVTRLEEYESLEKVRAQFVRIITHDLRNPLTHDRLSRFSR